MAKSFQEFLRENYRTALLISIPVKNDMTLGIEDTPLYYENLKTEKFDLMLYLKSFKQKQVKIDLDLISLDFRALVYYHLKEYVIIIFDSWGLHRRVAKGLDEAKQKRNFLNIEYNNIYQHSFDGKGSTDSWCLPIIFTSGKILTNIEDVAITRLDKAVNLKEKLMLSKGSIESLRIED